MNIYKTFVIAVLAGTLLVCCNSNPGNRNYESGEGMAKMETAGVPPPPQSGQFIIENAELSPVPATGEITAVVTRKVIKDGRMEIRVKELEQGKKDIDSMVKKYKGYYADETFNNMDYAHGFSLKIKIPAVSFDSFIAEIESGAGEVAFKNITSRDVTEEFIDLETRLKNKNNYLTRYNELLKQAKTVKDILEIEEKTRLIEEEVESVQGRLKYLSNQVDFSTLDLQLSKKNDYNAYSNNKGSFIDRLKLSLVKGWFGMVSFTLFVIRIWPFWIIMGGLLYLIRKLWRRRKNRLKS